MGAILSVVQLSYPGQETRTNDLVTYPALFMGLGNLVSVPLSMIIGRRPVFLGSLALMIAGGAWCAASKSLGSHIAGRMVMSVAAGQSESLVPLMVQEMYFLHNRSRHFGWMLFIQNVGVGSFFIASQHLVAAFGWRWWYGLFTIINGVILALSIPLAAETAFERSEADLAGNASRGAESSSAAGSRAITLAEHDAALENMKGRHWHDGLGWRTHAPWWTTIRTFYWQLLQCVLIWPIFLLFLINGALLGLYVFQSATFAVILIQPPYRVPFVNLAYVQGAQVLVSFIFLPLLGHGSDWMIKVLTRRNNSIYKPEYRLVPFIIPAIVGVVSAVIYGQAAHPRSPDQWTWAGIAVPYNGVFFAFVGAAIVGLTYSVDSFPAQAGPLLVLICAGRGIVSFGLSYATLPAVQSVGIDGLMNILAIISGVLSLLLIPAFFLGWRSRSWAHRFLFKTT
ncbi:hypothetical protein NLU13_9107 [Sarocladium strictum]|uniref:Major facilitator superfamily (MFS) profile domain-containing protein n=1 Tax=Sarocladium strictum TaxID=5046 RepID=A0AA39L444_SARSR|nr:hypothetical protein NLU13_9107 [Sarocladium strictum]